MSPLQPQSLGNAILTRNGRIAAIGDRRDLMKPGLEITDLGDAHLFPGFVESHAHLWWMGQLASQVDCGPDTNRSVNDILRRVSDAARRQPVRTWIQGHHWDDGALQEGRPPTRDELSRAAPHHPVYLVHNSSHLAVVNQRAFDIANITYDTSIPGVVRDSHGQLTGLLLEAAALESVSRHIPLPSVDEIHGQIRHAVNLCHQPNHYPHFSCD